MSVPSLAIVILNWNGWNDTCECLASLMDSTYQDFQILCLDNGSADDSIENIRAWAQGKILQAVGPDISDPKRYYVEFSEYNLTNKKYTFPEDLKKPYPGKLCMFKSSTNLGFSKGCNICIRYAIQTGFRHVLLLNNDTTVDPFCLEILMNMSTRYPNYPILTSTILYYGQPNKIWCLGGKLTFTGRRYFHYGNQDYQQVKTTINEVSFISGCVLFAQVSLFHEHGMLSERFFFGEEDYEFALRMRKHHVKMAGLSEAKVYHKINQSNLKMFPQNRISYSFIGYLNRFVDRKLYSTSITKWKIWRLICYSYIIPKLVIIHRYSLKTIVKFVKNLTKHSNKLRGVPREIVLKSKEWF